MAKSDFSNGPLFQLSFLIPTCHVFQRKALVPKVFEILVPRYSGSKEPYTRVYKMPPNAVDKFPMGIVEFLQNNLPPLEPSEDELVKFKREFLLEKLESKLSHEGFLV